MPILSEQKLRNLQNAIREWNQWEKSEERVTSEKAILGHLIFYCSSCDGKCMVKGDNVDWHYEEGHSQDHNELWVSFICPCGKSHKVEIENSGL